MKIIRFIKDWALPISMLLGAALCPLFVFWGEELKSCTSFFTATLIFVMLLLAFCKVSPRELRVKPVQLWLLGLQLFFAAASYLLLVHLNPVVAQGALVCFIAPTATAAVVITVKLGGNGTSITSYTMLINIAVAILVPLVFPLVYDEAQLGFWRSFSMILIKVFPLLITPFFLAWLLSKYAKPLHQKLIGLHDLAFYLWAICIVVVTAQTLATLITDESADGNTELMLAGVSLIACCIQFFVGRTVGQRIDGDSVCGGQAMGQKNTILAIWIALEYLHPLSAVAPGAYVLWQNIFNSWQLWQKRKKRLS